MCELCFANTGDSDLNRMLFLLVGTMGSTEHKDGWGFSDGTNMEKCEFPLYFDDSAGRSLKETLGDSDKPLIGHIRKASAMVPVNKENAHPFVKNGITFVHNGTLKPVDPLKYPMEYSTEVPDKNGNLVKRFFNHSDSKVFFDAFLNNYAPDKDLVVALNETMDDFYGKFAFMFSINGETYIARGKTANLYISYRMDKGGESGQPIGYIVHTNNSVLDTCEVLVENIWDLQGKEELFFSPPVLLKENTVFFADKLGVIDMGELKERSAPVTTYAKEKTWEGGYGSATENFSGTGASTGGISDGKVDKYVSEVLKFMSSFSLSVRDIQVLLMEIYDSSSMETEEAVIHHFVDKVIPNLANKTNKNIRRPLKTALGNLPVGLMHYYNAKIEFPWMLNSKEVQKQFVEILEAENKK